MFAIHFKDDVILQDQNENFKYLLLDNDGMQF